MPRSLALLLAFGVIGCDSARPCSICPPLEGTYALTYSTTQASNDCLKAGIEDQPTEVTLKQVGSVVQSRLEGLDLSGTVYDTYAFSLSGSGSLDGGSDHYHLRGTFLPPSSVTDGGTLIRGILSGTHQRTMGPEGKLTCSTDHNFVGTKQ